jgi:hypothetical protein
LLPKKSYRPSDGVAGMIGMGIWVYAASPNSVQAIQPLFSYTV